MTWSELMTGETEKTIKLEGLEVTLSPMKAGALADCCKEGEMDVFEMVSTTVKEPKITAEEARGLKPGTFAKLASECHKVNGTDEDLE